MTHDEVQAIKQRTREAWAKYQKSMKPGRVVPFFRTEAEREQHLREVDEAQRAGSPF